MIARIDGSKTLTEYISCKCKCRFDGKNVTQIHGGTTTNVDVSVKKIMYVKKIMFGILLTCSCKNRIAGK